LFRTAHNGRELGLSAFFEKSVCSFVVPAECRGCEPRDPAKDRVNGIRGRSGPLCAILEEMSYWERALDPDLTVDGVLDRPQETSRKQTARRVAASLFTELRDPVSRYLLHIGHGPGDIEEIVQETFLKLFRHLCAGGDETNLRGWVFRVAHNVAANERKRRRRTEARDTEALIGHGVAEPGSSPEHLVLEGERLQVLQRALNRLPEAQRACIHLRAEGLKYREIAQVLGIGVTTVADHLKHALEQLGEDCSGR
jgi:RNA polymerase sigma-70 factor, ECF subfamily